MANNKNAVPVRMANNDAVVNAMPVYVTNADEIGGGGTGAVSSVNGKTGAVVLSATDIKTSSNTSVEDEISTIDTRIDNLENSSGGGGTIDSINDANDVNIDTSKLAMLITDEQTQLVSQAEILKRVDLDLYKAIGSFGATDAETTITHSGTKYTLLNWTNLTISDVGIDYANGVFTSTTRKGQISIKAVISGYKKTSSSPYIAILKNGVKIKEIAHQGSQNVTSINEIEIADVDFVVGDTFSIGIRPYNTISGGEYVINNVPTTLNLSANGGGTREVVKMESIESGFATEDYVDHTFLPVTELPNVINHTDFTQLADVNIDKSRGTFQLGYLNPVTDMFMGIDLVEEALDYNNILVHPIAGALAYGANDIVLNTAPEELHGTLFSINNNGVIIGSPTNEISVSARLKLIGNGIDNSHPVNVTIQLLQNDVVIAERITTITSNAPLTSVVDSVMINANVNDRIHVRVSYSDNGNHSTLSLDGTGYIRLYNANENDIKFPNSHLQSDYYHDGTIANLALTTTNQTILSTTLTENITIKPSGIKSRINVTRTGGGSDGIVHFTLLKNGVALGNEIQNTLGSGDVDTIDPDNIFRYSFISGDVLSIQARYTGSGTATLSSGAYSVLGVKL